jgi:hypothetical protein
MVKSAAGGKETTRPTAGASTDPGRSARRIHQFRSYGKKSPQTQWIWIVVDDLLIVSMASPSLYPCYHAFHYTLLKKGGVGVAPGVDFGEAGKRAVRFSYARGMARSIGE